jgi:hypothetical protein
MKKKSNSTSINFENDFVQYLIARVSNNNLAEAIMASGADLGIILKGAFDYKSNPQFDNGEHVFCETMIYDYYTEKSRIDNNSEYREIGECVIMDFNPYNNQYSVSFVVFMQDGTTKTNSRVVEAHTLSPAKFEMSL